jgi:hypothetical protein
MAEMQSPNPEVTPGDGGTPRGLRALERALVTLRHTIRTHLFVQRGAAIAAWAVGSGVLVGVLDYFLRMPSPLRIVLWLVGAVTVALAVRRNLGPLAKFQPSLTDLALKVEESEAGKKNNWRGVLASGLELGRRGAADPGIEGRMAAASAEVASSRFLADGLSIPGLLDNTRLRMALTKCLVVLGVIAALGFWQPTLMRIGTQRVVFPWMATQWPKRTGIIAAEAPAAHALGTVFPLQALLTRSSRSASETRVVVNYRVVGPHASSEVQRALLTAQGRRVRADGAEDALGAPSLEGDLFEQLLDTQRLSDLAVASGVGVDAEFDLEYWFETSDDETGRVHVKMVEPPRVASATVTVTPPAYAAALAGRAGLVAGAKSAGDGRDDRATVGPILAGSRVEVVLALSKDVPAPVGEDATRAWLAAVAPGLADVPGVTTKVTSREVAVAFDASASVRAGVTLTDAYGITSREPAVFRLDVVEDRAASAVVVEPSQDESVLATAVVGATGEGRDDLGVAWVRLRSQVARVDATSVGAAPEASGGPTELARSEGAGDGVATTASATIDLGEQTLKPGDEVWLTAEVADVLAAGGPGQSGRGPVVSAVRRLRIISESELVEQFRGELASLRDAARQMEVEQNGLIEQRAASVADGQQEGERGKEAAGERAAEQSRKQQGIAQRLTPFQKSLERLSQRADRNNLADESLKGLLEDAQDAAAQAKDASGQAAQALNEDAKNEQAARAKQLAEEIDQTQAQAAGELSSLAEMLSQGEDQWAVRRSLEKLLTEQRQLRSQTGAAGQSTQGKEMKDLPREQREDLERLARKQQELSQQAAQALDALEQRAQQMQEADSAQARAMQQAASRARQKQLVQKQSNAGQNLRQNQTGQAQQQQKQAEEAIEEALENLDQAQQAQDEKLRRVLADIVESLRTLVAQQETELSRLARAQDGGTESGLDKGMMLVHQNTLGVLKKARDEVKNPGALASHLDGAQQAQSSAVSVLRGATPDFADADEMERVSLQRLRDALAEAEKQSEDANEKAQDQARKELRKAYREMLELQVALKAETDPLIGADTGRRARQSLREFGRRQDELRARMDEVRGKTEGLAEAKVFDYAHTRFGTVTTGASKDLSAGQGTRAAQRHQAAAVAILQSLVEALKEDKKKDDDLEEDEGGGGGGGQTGGKPPVLPPIAELVLLRGMQAEAAARTRALSDQGADATEMGEVSSLQDELSRQGQDLLERMQRQPGVQPPTLPNVKPVTPGEGDKPGEGEASREEPSDEPAGATPEGKPKPAEAPDEEEPDEDSDGEGGGT